MHQKFLIRRQNTFSNSINVSRTNYFKSELPFFSTLLTIKNKMHENLRGVGGTIWANKDYLPISTFIFTLLVILTGYNGIQLRLIKAVNLRFARILPMGILFILYYYVLPI